MSWLDLIGPAKDFVVATSAGVAATCAVVGLKAWRKELRGKAEYEAARAFLRSTYKLREAVRLVRNPFIDASEFPENYRGVLGGQTAEDEAAAYSYVYSTRWNQIGSSISDFDAAALEAEVVLGAKLRTAGQCLRKHLGVLHASIRQYVENKASDGENARSDPDHQTRIEAIIWEGVPGRTNKFTDDFDRALEAIEEFLAPHLRQ